MLTAGVLVAAAGCMPPTDTTTIVGDSLTLTTLLDGQLPAEWDVLSGLGWEAEDAQPGLTERALDPDRAPGCVVIALGANDGADHSGRGPEWGDGFTATDAEQIAQLADTPHPAASVVWVLPHYAGTDPEFAAGVAAYREWVRSFATGRGEPVVDFALVARPDHFLDDGVHFTPTGFAAYGATLRDAEAHCA